MYEGMDLTDLELLKQQTQGTGAYATPSSPMAILSALQMAQKFLPQQPQTKVDAVNVGGGNAASFKPMPFGMGLYSPQVLRRLYGR